MKVLYFTDAHFHNWPLHSSILASGRNSRFQDALDILDQIFEYSKANNINTILFGGDLFETRKRIVVPIFNEVFVRLKAMAALNIKLFLLPGNHDQADKTGTTHALEAFKEFATVMDEPGWYIDQDTGLGILACPYTEDFEQVKKTLTFPPDQPVKYPIIMLHTGIEGAKLSINDFELDGNIKQDDIIQNQKYKFCLVGHYHLPQDLGNNIIYGGSPSANTWGDPPVVGRGFIEADLNTGEYKRIPVKAPQFLVVPHDELETFFDQLKDNFVRVLVPKRLSKTEHDQLHDYMKTTGARDFIIEDTPQADPAEVDPSRPVISPATGYAEMVGQYVEKIAPNYPELVEAPVLQTIGMDIINQVLQEEEK